MYRSGAMRRGGVISPLYNGDGVLNLPHEHGSYDARDAGASVLIDRKARRNINRATMTPSGGKSSIGAVTNNKGGKMGKKDGEVSPYEQGIVLLVVLIAITLIMVWLAQ